MVIYPVFKFNTLLRTTTFQNTTSLDRTIPKSHPISKQQLIWNSKKNK